MNKCYKCGAEFEGKFCPHCGTKYEVEKACPQCNTKLDGNAKFCNNCGYGFVQQPQQQYNSLQSGVTNTLTVTNETIKRIWQQILKFAPIVLYTLWAGLLWAFYSAKLINQDMLLFELKGNIYEIMNDAIFAELHQPLKILIKIIIIADIYAIILLFAQIKGNKKVKLVANITSIVIQLGVIVDTLVLSSKIKAQEIDQGSMVAITVALTAVFAVIAIALQFIQGFIDKKSNSYNNSEQIKVKRKVKIIWDVRKIKWDQYEALGFALTIGMLLAILLIVFIMNK